MKNTITIKVKEKPLHGLKFEGEKEMMNIELLKKYLRPGAMVYLLRAEEIHLGLEAYYVPCRIVNMEFESSSSYCGVYDIPRFELRFNLINATNSKIEYNDVKSGDVYIIHESTMCGIPAFLYRKEREFKLESQKIDAASYYPILKHRYQIPPFEPDYFDYKKIIFSGNCTIIIWKDGTKAMARCSKGDDFSPEAGLAICFMKHALGERKAKKILRNGNKIFKSEAEV